MLNIYCKIIHGLTRHLDRFSNYFILKSYKKSQYILSKILIILLRHHCYKRKLSTAFWRKKNLLKLWMLINCGLSSTTGSAEAAASRVLLYAVRTYRHLYYFELHSTVFHFYVFHLCVVRMWGVMWVFCHFSITIFILLQKSDPCQRIWRVWSFSIPCSSSNLFNATASITL